MLNSPLTPNVRGLNEALQFMDREGLRPMLLVCIDPNTGTLAPVVLDASDMTHDEETRTMLHAAMLRAVAAKLRG